MSFQDKSLQCADCGQEFTFTAGEQEFYASRGLEVVVIRFGGVRIDDRMVDETGYRSFWLSRKDCAHMVNRAIEADIPQKFVRVFAVSDNPGRIHDISSAKKLLGYKPQVFSGEI